MERGNSKKEEEGDFTRFLSLPMPEEGYRYFSRQGPLDQLCLVYALNHLIQNGEKESEPIVTKEELDNIARDLAPGTNIFTNPHKSWLGLGNYDCNVLMAYLQRCGLETRFFDRRLSLEELQLGTEDPASPQKMYFAGLILNVPSSNAILRTLGFKGRHWTTIRLVRKKTARANWFWFDSRRRDPVLLGEEGVEGEKAVRDFLSRLVSANRGEILIVSEKRVNTTD